MPAELVHSHRLQTGKLGFLTTTAPAFLTAEAEADGIIHAGWAGVNSAEDAHEAESGFGWERDGFYLQVLAKELL